MGFLFVILARARCSRQRGVSLDYLVGNNSVMVKDKKITERLEAIASMPDDEQKQIFNVIDALVRDFKTKQAYK